MNSLNRPYSATELRNSIQSRIADQGDLPSPCTKRQASMIARYMSAMFTMRFIRLAILEWILYHPIASSNDLTMAEARALLDWLSSDPALMRTEAGAVLMATFMGYSDS